MGWGLGESVCHRWNLIPFPAVQLESHNVPQFNSNRMSQCGTIRMSQCGTITILIWADQLECQPVKELSDFSLHRIQKIDYCYF